MDHLQGASRGYGSEFKDGTTSKWLSPIKIRTHIFDHGPPFLRLEDQSSSTDQTPNRRGAGLKAKKRQTRTIDLRSATNPGPRRLWWATRTPNSVPFSTGVIRQLLCYERNQEANWRSSPLMDVRRVVSSFQVIPLTHCCLGPRHYARCVVFASNWSSSTTHSLGCWVVGP